MMMGASMTTMFRTVQGTMTATVATSTAAVCPSARRQPKPATSHTMGSSGRKRSEIGRTSAESPSSTPKSSKRPRPNCPPFQLPERSTTSAAMTRKLKSVSVRKAAV